MFSEASDATTHASSYSREYLSIYIYVDLCVDTHVYTRLPGRIDRDQWRNVILDAHRGCYVCFMYYIAHFQRKFPVVRVLDTIIMLSIFLYACDVSFRSSMIQSI